MSEFTPDLVHTKLLEHKPLLAFCEKRDFAEWKTALKDKLTELIGDMPGGEAFGFELISVEDCGGYDKKRFVFYSEQYVKVPAYLLVPHGKEGKIPVVICLQGHSTGMHISLGEKKFDGDETLIASGDRDFALQAVAQGYCALVIEQRCFAERSTDRTEDFGYRCFFPSASALLVGRTMIGERVLDVMRAIDALHNFPEADTDKIACMGNSGGGTVSFYAACMDERIKIAMPSCSVCTFRHSIGAVYHCICNYIPGIAKYMDMGDMAALIAPRPLVVVAGAKDEIFPIEGVKESFSTIEKIYVAAGKSDRCRLVIGEEGHRFYAVQAWEAFRSMTEKELGW